METKEVLLELKATSDAEGTFTGYLAVFKNPDGNGDIIEPGAFKKTLQEARQKKARDTARFLYPLLWQGKEDDPIGGILDASEDSTGLAITGEYDLDTVHGKAAYSGAKKGYLRGLSIGYKTIKSVYDENRYRHLTEIQLFCGSPATFPANDLAQIGEVKARDTILANLRALAQDAEAFTARLRPADVRASQLDVVEDFETWARQEGLLPSEPEETMAHKAMRDLRKIEEDERADPQPRQKDYPIAYEYWLRRQLARQAERDKWKQYLP
jgi:Escherichia/Staphylococcus phage prohead protease